MTDEFDIRESLPTDMAALDALYPLAFPDEDLLPLARDLLRGDTHVLSLVAIAGPTLVGHIVFTMCGLAGRSGSVALLGPLAVAPHRQRRGIGGALVRDGLRRLKGGGATQVQVLGDPAYYGRLGFEPDGGVAPPYPVPDEWRAAWQSIRLRDGDPPLQGTLSVPSPWRQPALWAP
jgi:putative acetyltransferase